MACPPRAYLPACLPAWLSSVLSPSLSPSLSLFLFAFVAGGLILHFHHFPKQAKQSGAFNNFQCSLMCSTLFLRLVESTGVYGGVIWFRATASAPTFPGEARELGWGKTLPGDRTVHDMHRKSKKIKKAISIYVYIYIIYIAAIILSWICVLFADDFVSPLFQRHETSKHSKGG